MLFIRKGCLSGSVFRTVLTCVMNGVETTSLPIFRASCLDTLAQRFAVLYMMIDALGDIEHSRNVLLNYPMSCRIWELPLR